MGYPKWQLGIGNFCQRFLLLELAPRHQSRLFLGNALKQLTRRLITWILRYQFAHHAQLQQGLFKGVDAGFGGEQGVEVFGQALPVGSEVGRVAGKGQAVE
ncbi:hypothetical protein D3C85_1590170 [compost metagenome]